VVARHWEINLPACVFDNVDDDAECQVQGMSFIAAVLLLNMDDVDTFVCFANLLNKPCEVAFFRLDENLVRSHADFNSLI